MYFHETRMINRWWNWITDRPLAIYILLLGVAVYLVGLVSFPDYYNSEFWKNIRVEAHGMLFDILVLGLLFSWLHGLGEKRRLIKRYEDEIDDFRGWKSEEAARRIRGNILRLNREGVHKINLHNCFLKGVHLGEAKLGGAILDEADLRDAILRDADLGRAIITNADLRGIDLNGAILDGANLIGANFEEVFLGSADDLSDAKLMDADLRGVDLRGAKGLTIKQLREAKTLYQAKLDPELESQVKEKCPQLLEKPDKPGKTDG